MSRACGRGSSVRNISTPRFITTSPRNRSRASSASRHRMSVSSSKTTWTRLTRCRPSPHPHSSPSKLPGKRLRRRLWNSRRLIVLNFLLLMIFPVLIALATLLAFKGKVLFWEFAAQVGVVALFVGVALACVYEGRTYDTEVWNGQVTEREHHHVSCEHSYECNCYTDDKGNRHCSTCYEHLYDVDWTVHASTGEAIDIAREDRQGLTEPKRWDAVFPGEPFESKHHFTNYILANPDSVLLGTKGNTERFGKWIPK